MCSQPQINSPSTTIYPHYTLLTSLHHTPATLTTQLSLSVHQDFSEDADFTVPTNSKLLYHKIPPIRVTHHARSDSNSSTPESKNTIAFLTCPFWGQLKFCRVLISLSMLEQTGYAGNHLVNWCLAILILKVLPISF